MTPKALLSEKQLSKVKSVVQRVSPFRPFHVVVLGGGISGLVAAYTLKQNLKWPCQVTLIEKGPRVGGWVHTDTFKSGSFFERGTRSIRTAGKVGRNTLKLVSDLGLENEIILTNKQKAQKRYIYAEQKIIELPSTFWGLVRRIPPLPSALLTTFVKEMFIERGPADDMSVHDFFSRRIGDKMAQYLVDALCLGVFASESKTLSMQSCFPQLWQYEQEYGSLVLGGLLSTPDLGDHFDHPLCVKARDEKWNIWSMKNGLSSITDKLLETIQDQDVDVQLSTICDSLELTKERQWTCHTSNGTFKADHVISALPCFALASMLKKSMFRMASLLNQIPWTSVAVVSLKYNRRVLPREGFGILCPACEGTKVLGVVYDSAVFPQHSRAPDETRLSVMLGGNRFESMFGTPKDADLEAIYNVALKELEKILNIKEKPVDCVTYINEDCIPQYAVGHNNLLMRIENEIALNNLPLTLTGSSYRGVSVNDVIYYTQEKVDSFISSINDQHFRLACL